MITPETAVIIGVAFFCIACWALACHTVYENMIYILRRRKPDTEDWLTAAGTILFAPVIGITVIILGILGIAVCVIFSPGLIPVYVIYRVAKRSVKQ